MRHRIESATELGLLSAVEPSDDELRRAAPTLACAYGDPHNAAMMGHLEAFTADEVVEHYEELVAEGGHAFLLYVDGALVGDADLRDLDPAARSAELAIMLTTQSTQGRGLGTRFAVMLHAFAFRVLELDRLYVAILPANTASSRLFAKLGYREDLSPAARALVDDELELTLSVERAAFERAHHGALDGVRIERVE